MQCTWIWASSERWRFARVPFRCRVKDVHQSMGKVKVHETLTDSGWPQTIPNISMQTNCKPIIPYGQIFVGYIAINAAIVFSQFFILSGLCLNQCFRQNAETSSVNNVENVSMPMLRHAILIGTLQCAQNLQTVSWRQSWPIKWARIGLRVKLAVTARHVVTCYSMAYSQIKQLQPCGTCGKLCELPGWTVIFKLTRRPWWQASAQLSQWRDNDWDKNAPYFIIFQCTLGYEWIATGAYYIHIKKA